MLSFTIYFIIRRTQFLCVSASCMSMWWIFSIFTNSCARTRRRPSLITIMSHGCARSCACVFVCSNRCALHTHTRTHVHHGIGIKHIGNFSVLQFDAVVVSQNFPSHRQSEKLNSSILIIQMCPSVENRSPIHSHT